MKKKHLLLIVLIISKFGFSQTVNQNSISYKGLNFYSTKGDIIKTLGQPKDNFNPDYECGFLSGDYITLDYGYVKFTRNKDESYLIEEISFENDNSLEVKYEGHILTSKTDIIKLIEIFGKAIKTTIENYKNDTLLIPFEEPDDDAILIEIKEGKLITLKYWSPC